MRPIVLQPNLRSAGVGGPLLDLYRAGRERRADGAQANDSKNECTARKGAHGGVRLRFRHGQKLLLTTTKNRNLGNQGDPSLAQTQLHDRSLSQKWMNVPAGHPEG